MFYVKNTNGRLEAVKEVIIRSATTKVVIPFSLNEPYPFLSTSEIYDVFAPEQAKVKEPIQITLACNRETVKPAVYNEAGAGVSSRVVEIIDREDGDRDIKIEVTVSTAGRRKLVIYGVDEHGDRSEKALKYRSS